MESKPNELYSSSLKSHPDKLLVEHLHRVGEICRSCVKEKKLNIDDVDLLKDAIYLIGITHDLGKATDYFQKYIMEKNEKKKKSLKAKDITHHGLLSALFSYAVMREYLNQRELKDGLLAEYLPIMSFLAVKRHHGNLLNAIDEIKDIDIEKEKILKLAEVQIKSIDKNELCKILEDLISREGIKLKIDLGTIISYIENDEIKNLRRKEKDFIRGLYDKGNLFPYFIFQFIYSSLLDADKTDAGLDGIILDRISVSSSLVDDYREAKGFVSNQDNINGLRNEIYNEAMQRINEWNLNSRILSLNVPTGTGKTLTALSLSLKLRERLENDLKIKPRIIYALPFLSIIDQNYKVFENVVGRGKDNVDSRLLLKHHHLAEVKYRAEEDEYRVDKSLLLLEGWNAEIIVTTFWQLFNTLFSNRNKQLRKFNKIVNSIIILDEVQAVPHRYWLLIHDSLNLICEKFNTYIVFITATQPLIFDESKGEIDEISKKKKEYFKKLNRIELLPRLEKELTIAEFNSLLSEELIKKNEKDFLIVLNTISSAQETYKYIKRLQLDNTKTFFLSTNVIPKTRLARINEIKESKKSPRQRKVIVSTQLIEAGVDIDADIVYRDFAPLDSINQVAGRCNRNSSKGEKGTVSIFILKDERKAFYRYIYDPILISTTLDILRPIEGPIKESEFLDLNNKYFKALKLAMGDRESKDCLDRIAGLAFKDLNESFKLIEEDYPKVDVFVELDDEAENIWKQYLEMQSEKDHQERTKKYLKIKKEFSEYVISAEEKFAHSLVDSELGIGYISRAEISNYYDDDTGFMRAVAGGGTMII